MNNNLLETNCKVYIHIVRTKIEKLYIKENHQALLPDIVIGRSSTCVIPIAFGGKSGCGTFPSLQIVSSISTNYIFTQQISSAD